jgi:hypothetical protein
MHIEVDPHPPSPWQGEASRAKQRAKQRYWLFAQPITPQAMRAPESPDG